MSPIAGAFLGAARVAPMIVWALPIERRGLLLRGVATLLGIAFVWPAIARAGDATPRDFARELAVGMTLGLAAAVPVRAAELASRMITSGAPRALGSGLEVLALAVFAAAGGMRLWLTAIANSYATIPVGTRAFSTGDVSEVARLLALVWQTALALAMPIVVTIALVELVRALLVRVQPVFVDVIGRGELRAVASTAAVFVAAAAWVAAIASAIR